MSASSDVMMTAAQPPAATVGPDLRLPFMLCAGWGLGALTMGVMANVFNVLVLRFATDYLGIAAGAAGLALGLSKITDAVIDPIIGTVSDNLTSKSGRRRPLLLAAAILGPLATLCIFFAPHLPPLLLVLYYAASLIFFSTAYGLWTVPYLAMSAEMTHDYHERSRLVSFRVIGSAFGVLVGTLCGPWLIVQLGSDHAAYQKMSVVTAIVIFVISLTCFRLTRGARFQVKTAHQSMSLTRQFKLLAANRPLAQLVAMKGFWYVNVASGQASIAYFLKYVAKLPDVWLGWYFVIMVLAMVAAQPVWVAIAKIIDKRFTMIAALAIYALDTLSWMLTGPSEPRALFVVQVCILGASSGGVLLFIQSMFNDAIELDYLRNGQRREGAFTGLYALIEKVFVAAGVAGFGVILGMGGYISSKSSGVAVQPAQALFAMQVGFSLLPSAGAVAGIVIMALYRLRSDDLMTPKT